MEPIEDSGRFVKVLGKQNNSIGEKLIELDNGDLLALGHVGIPAHTWINTGGGIELERTQDISPALIPTDH